MSKQIPNQYIYLFNETRTYPSSSVPSFKQQYIDVCIMKFAWKAVVSCPKTQLFFAKETKKAEKFHSMKNVCFHSKTTG